MAGIEWGSKRGPRGWKERGSWMKRITHRMERREGRSAIGRFLDTLAVGFDLSKRAFDDGSEEGYQCARCGSSVVWFDCDNCGGVGAYDTNYVDDEWDDPYQRCPDCSGNGGWNLCASSAEYCNAHPIAGREDVPRGKIEWFTRPPRSSSPDTRDNG